LNFALTLEPSHVGSISLSLQDFTGWRRTSADLVGDSSKQSLQWCAENDSDERQQRLLSLSEQRHRDDARSDRRNQHWGARPVAHPDQLDCGRASHERPECIRGISIGRVALVSFNSAVGSVPECIVRDKPPNHGADCSAKDLRLNAPKRCAIPVRRTAWRDCKRSGADDRASNRSEVGRGSRECNRVHLLSEARARCGEQN
jgi:hypothetical protein